MGPETLNAICVLVINRSVWAEDTEGRVVHEIIQAEEKRKEEKTEEEHRKKSQKTS